MYRSAVYDEPLLIELKQSTKQIRPRISLVPKALRRRQPVTIPQLDEPEIIRHFVRLSQMNHGIDTGIYPLGSCTMKYNPKLGDEISSWDSFTAVHPYQDESTVQGCLEVMYKLEQMLCEISGMNKFTLQPAAGAQGELTGMLLTKTFHEHNHDNNRNEVIVPDTAHGTNPASVTMAGYNVVEIPSTKAGTVDLKMLQNALSNKTACFMLTNPNTLGIFESDILEISELVHDAGALLYYDGANINAIMGKTRPGDMGFDIVHLNLHKTFSTPHGGGGPGAGPVGVKNELSQFLPIPQIKKNNNDTYYLDYDYPHSIGKIKAFYGNFSVLLRAYAYILLMGSDGLKETSEIAVLNANYMKQKLVNSGKYDLPYQDLRKHEFVLSCERLQRDKGVRAVDVAKRLLDYGLHPPTVYFPLIIKEALMIEPTESESRQMLDRYVETLIAIADEVSKVVKAAPCNTSVGRVDEASAAKNPVVTWRTL
jgi:glycine dehydrogenase subunit 2